MLQVEAHRDLSFEKETRQIYAQVIIITDADLCEVETVSFTQNSSFLFVYLFIYISP